MLVQRAAIVLCGAICVSCGNDAADGEGGGRPAPVAASVETEIAAAQLGDLLAGVDATFVVSTAGATQRYNPQRAAERYLPASTFKIANSLIALETGVVPDAEYTLSRDPALAPAESWWPQSWLSDHTLRSAFRNSVVWYYQELARRIGPQRMQSYLRRFGYGNLDISGGIDQFWLRGGLRISADEQVAFLEKLYDGKLGVSQRTTELVKDIMLIETNAGYRLSGKTGTAPIDETRELGWMVGWAETGTAVYFYALNMEGDEVAERWPPQHRAELVKALLHRLQIITDSDA